VTWFQKFLGLGKKENTVLTLKLRLNRWRHFLRTEWACTRLLNDLEEKSWGEYIFDRQYVYSTVGRIFQQAYQLAYDGTLLLRNPERELYDWLDQQKEKTLSYLSQYSKEGKPSIPASMAPTVLAEVNSRIGESWEAELNLAQEPEFRMLNGVIALLNENHTPEEKSAADTLKEIHDLRKALRWVHEKVLQDLINPEVIREWVESGLTVSWRGTPSYLIDLEQESGPEIKVLKGEKTFKPERSVTTWPILQDILTVFAKNPSGLPEKNRLSLCFIIKENALFLFGFDSEATIWMDLVLTNVRELNHFLFRWEKRAKESPAILQKPPPWEWTYQREGKIFEFVAFQKSSREIESYGEMIGKALG
jgi:hypothetical protein